MIPAGIFREYDVRGVAGRDLTPEVAYWIGRAFGEMAVEQGHEQALVGRDNRLSSPELKDAVAAGMGRAGLRVVDIGQVVTPVFYYARILYKVPAGVMVTASHNPGDENGFKLALSGPGTLYGQAIQEVRARAERLAAQGTASGREAASRVEYRDPVPAYLEMITQKVRLSRPLHVVVDAGNGTASDLAPRLFSALGCKVTPLYCESDPTFPHHHPDPVRPENLQDLIRTVKETGADLGLGFDGDGDRLGAVADDGTILYGDQLMILFWREILPRYPGALALIEVKCSQAVVDEVLRLGGRPEFHRTGHSYIKASLYSRGAPFAGEMSGHMFFNDEYYGYDDALYAGARLLRLVSSWDRPLSAVVQELPRYVSTPEVRVNCPDDRKQDVVQGVLRHFRARREVIDVDGVRVLYPGGWGLVRASNTQPVLVLRCEAKTEEELEAICRDIESVLGQYPEVGPVVWH